MSHFSEIQKERGPDLVISPRASLQTEPSVSVELGLSPDHLPLLLRVDCLNALDSTFFHALGLHSRGELPNELQESFSRFEEALGEYVRSRGVVPDGPTSETSSSYVSSSKIDLLTGASMMARALGGQSPLMLVEDLENPNAQPERVSDTRALLHADQPEGAPRQFSGLRRLAVPCEGAEPWIVQWEGPGEEESMPRWIRPYQCESIAHFPEARFHAKQGHDEVSGFLSDRDSYLAEIDRANAIGWSLPRVVIGEAIAELAERLEENHSNGLVHGDLKPQNTLILPEGTLAFDSLDVRAGDLSPAATPGWAAPEQVLGREVSPATDIFALGLMTSALFGAAIHGEERTFIIPTGGAKRHRLRILVSSDVFLDPVGMDIFGTESIPSWRAFLKQAVSFDPAARFESGNSFASELRTHLEDHPPQGSVFLGGGPGVIYPNVIRDGAPQPAWVITDHR